LSIIGRFGLRSKLERREDATAAAEAAVCIDLAGIHARSQFELDCRCRWEAAAQELFSADYRTMAAGRNDVRISRPATWSSTGYRQEIIDWGATAAAADSQPVKQSSSYIASIDNETFYNHKSISAIQTRQCNSD